MRVLIVSDSHGRTDHLKKAVALVKPERMLHLGDAEGQEDYIASFCGCPLDIVKGNCDYMSRLPAQKVIPLGKHRIFMAHGHLHYVKGGLQEIESCAKDAGADVVLYGHTHLPELVYEPDGMVVVNPGSISYPRQEGRKPCYAVLDVDEEGEFRFSLCQL